MTKLIQQLRAHPHLPRSVRQEAAVQLERLQRLEAALRAIAEASVRPATAGYELQQIARRAL